MRRILAAAMVLALTVAVGACGGGGGGAVGVTDATEISINPVPRDKLAVGGTLRWPVTTITPNFNYYHVDASAGYETQVIVNALMPWAFHTGATGEPSVNHDLLQSAALTARDPKQVVTYRINPKAAWSDGMPITWRDFEAQWRALNGTDTAYQASANNGYNQIEQVAQGVDEREVVVTFGRPYVDWQAIFSPLYPASTMSSPAVFNTGWADGPITTAGPFRPDSVDRTAQTVTLARNERWWGSPAKLDRIIYRAIEGDAQVAALANGEVDLADVGPDVNKFAQARSTPGVDLRVAAGPSYRQITFNGQSEILSDLRVRRAVAMSIDRETIARALIGPLSIPPLVLGNHIFMANQTGYRDNAGVLAHDPAKAAALLDEAGWRRDGGIRERGGQPLRLRFVIPAARAESQQEAELVQTMLAEVGVGVTIQTVPAHDFFPSFLIPGNFDITTSSFTGVNYPISSSESLFAMPVSGPGGLIVFQNYARVSSPAIDDTIDRAIAELDPARAIELANAADVMIWEIAHSITTYQRPEIIAARSTLANFGAFGFVRPIPYADIGFTRQP